MTEIQFLVKGSSKEPYKVDFVKNNDILKAYCNCPAGQKKTHCKHRINIFIGNKENIVSNNAEEVAKVQKMLEGTELEKALNNYFDAEKKADAAKKKLSSAKKKLSKTMN